MNAETTGVIRGSAETRGTWPTGSASLVALAPLGIGLAIGIAMDGKPGLGPLTASQLFWWLLVPLAAIYPAVAAFARVQAYAPTTVLVVATIAPAFALASRLLLNALPRDRFGNAVVSVEDVGQRAIPPGMLAVGTFVAIEVATVGMRRGILLGVAGAIAGAAVFGATLYATIIVLGWRVALG
jgi:hypothetical protein